MQRLVEHIERRILDEGAGHQAEPLLPAGQPQERLVRQLGNPELPHPTPRTGVLLRRWMPIQPFGIEKAARDDVQRRRIHLEGPVQLRADKADFPLDVPDGLPRAARTAEQFDVTGIGLRVVGANQAQERTFAAAVGPGQRPVLPFPHRPVQRIQDHALPVADGHAAHPDYGRRQDGVQIRLQRHLLPRLPVRDGNHVGGKRRDLRHAGQYEHQRRRPGQVREQARQRLACMRIQPDVGIVDDQHLRAAQQRADELELAQFARRKRDQRLVQHRFQPEQGDQRVQARHRFRTGTDGFLAQLFPRRGRIVLEREEVPALLHEEVAVAVTPVRVAEGDVFRTAAARQGGSQAALAGGVGPHQGDLLPFPDFQLTHQPAIL